MNKNQTSLSSTLSCCSLLVAAVVGLWLLLAAPAWLMSGAAGLEGLTYSALLCLAPGLIVFGIVAWFSDSPSKVPMVVLGGTSLRLLFVLVGALALRDIRPDLGFREFVTWLLVYYLATLLVETLLAVRMSANASGQSRVSGA